MIGGAAVTFVSGLMAALPVIFAGRGVQGVGAALFIPASTALLLDVFPPLERGGAQGRMMVISMTVTAFAPTLIGLIIQVVSWPFAYLLTILAAAVALVMVGMVKYEQKKAAATPFDYLGAVLVFVAVALVTMGTMQAGTSGLTSAPVLLMVGAGLLVGLLLVVLSLRKQYPLIQFRVMKIRSVSVAVFISLMRFLPNVLMGAFVARYVQQVLGLSPIVAGLLMILPVLAQVVVAPVGGRMLDKGGARQPVVLGAALLIAGSALLGIAFPAQNLWLILIGTILGGAGFSFINPVQMAALTETPLAQRGMLAGIFPLAGNFGTALFVALLTTGLTALMGSYTTANPGATEAAAQASALGTLAWIAAGVTISTLVAALLLKKPAASPAPAAEPNTPAAPAA
jgi:MFS family permease